MAGEFSVGYENPSDLRSRSKAAEFIQESLRPVARIVTDPAYVESFEIRDYQLDAWSSIWRAREVGEASALVTLAPGLGKTNIAVFDVIKFRQELLEEDGREPKVLFVSNQERINAQASKRFAEFIPDMSQGRYDGTIKETDKDITFATFQSLVRHLEDFDPDEYDYIVYDEAHHTQANTWRRVVNHFTPGFQLAITATPYRTDGLNLLELFETEVYAKGLGEALAEGLLPDIDYHIVFDDTTREALESGFNPKTLKELRGLLDVPQRNEVIAQNILEKRMEIGAENAKTIVFCDSIEHADEMASLLGAKAYHSNAKIENDQTFAEFTEGDLDIICVRDMFNEGIDVPEAAVIVLLRGTGSRILFEQQVGRGTRKREGKDYFTVLDFVGNIERLQAIKELSDEVAVNDPEIEDDGWTIIDDDFDTAQHIPSRKRGGIRVTTGHAIFDFDELAVDLLSKYQAIMGEPAPEGYLSIDAYAKRLGVTNKTLKQLIARHQIPTGLHRFKSNVGRSLSPEAQSQVEQLGEILPPAPDDYKSTYIFAEELGISVGRLVKSLHEHGVPTERHRFNGQAAISLSPEAQQMAIEKIELARPPEGTVSAKAFAEEVGVDYRQLIKFINRNGIKTGRHQFGSTLAVSLSAKMQERLRGMDLSVSNVPEGYMSINAFATSLGIHPNTLRKRIEAEEIVTETFRSPRGNTAKYLSPDAQYYVKWVIENFS